ncbi:9782_t:CDS:2, partial [Acaulospora colombiana]
MKNASLNILMLDYWNRDTNTWGSVNDWDFYWIEKRPSMMSITKHDSHTALAHELRCLKQVYEDNHPAYKKACVLQDELQGSYLVMQPWVEKVLPWVKSMGSAMWNSSLELNSWAVASPGEGRGKKGRQAVHQIARRGCQAYSDIEFGPVEREQKRIRVNENETVEDSSPITIPLYQCSYSSNINSATPAVKFSGHKEQRDTIGLKTPSNDSTEVLEDDEEVKFNLENISSELKREPTVE